MSIGVLDIVAATYVFYCVRKGRKRHLSRELPSLVGWLVFFITGCGLYKWTGRALLEVNHLTRQSVGVISFLGMAFGTVMIVRRLRAHIGQWAEQKCVAETQKLAGAIAGGLRSFLIISIVLLTFAHWPLHFLTRPFAEGSLLGRSLVKFVLPVYEKTHD